MEVKWSDRPLTRQEEFDALANFSTRYPGLALGVTTRTRTGRLELETGHCVRFVPTALYAYALGALSARRDRPARCMLTRRGALDCAYALGG